MAGLKQFNYHPIWRPDVCKASPDKLPWLGENLGAALANRFNGLVHVLDVKAEVSDTVAALVNAISVRRWNGRIGALGIRCKNQRQSTEAQEISDAAVGAVRLPKYLSFEDVGIKTQASIRV